MCVCVCVCVCVWVSECVLQSRRRDVGERKEFKSSTLSLSLSLSLCLSVRGVDGCWIFQLSAAAVCLSIMEAVVASEQPANGS